LTEENNLPPEIQWVPLSPAYAAFKRTQAERDLAAALLRPKTLPLIQTDADRERYRRELEIRKLEQERGMKQDTPTTVPTDGHGHPGRPTNISPIARTAKELWQIGNQVLCLDPNLKYNQAKYAREYLKIVGMVGQRGGHSNPGSSLMNRVKNLLQVQDFNGFIAFLEGPEPT
jgi:hypothetical protein